jgi:hypothetical protein
MKFRLTYEGRLQANGSPDHKHEIRKAFHPQLKRLWEVEPNLKSWRFPESLSQIEIFADQFSRLDYHFVPLTTPNMSLIASLEILFLRPDLPGSVIQSGDIDNRLKTLFDALKMPSCKNDLGRYLTPGTDEDPFFVLLEDDNLISHVAVETDVLLQPTPSANGNFLPNDARLVITERCGLTKLLSETCISFNKISLCGLPPLPISTEIHGWPALHR